MSGQNGPGNAAVLLPGGAAEALEARPGNLTLNIKKHKGFVRTALRNGYLSRHFHAKKNCTRIYPNVPGIMLAGLPDDLTCLTSILRGNRPRSPSETDQHDSRDIWIDPRKALAMRGKIELDL